MKAIKIATLFLVIVGCLVGYKLFSSGKDTVVQTQQNSDTSEINKDL